MKWPISATDSRRPMCRCSFACHTPATLRSGQRPKPSDLIRPTNFVPFFLAPMCQNYRPPDLQSVAGPKECAPIDPQDRGQAANFLLCTETPARSFLLCGGGGRPSDKTLNPVDCEIESVLAKHHIQHKKNPRRMFFLNAEFLLPAEPNRHNSGIGHPLLAQESTTYLWG